MESSGFESRNTALAMSEENAEIVRRTVESFNRWTLAPECFDPEVEYTTQPDAPMHTTYKGLDGLARSMESLARSMESLKEAWEIIEAEVRQFIGSGDVLVALLHFHLRGHSGVELEADKAWAYWMREGKIRRMEQYGSKREALQAAGLAE
jgi:ketosteroid isomerase-like protein